MLSFDINKSTTLNFLRVDCLVFGNLNKYLKILIEVNKEDQFFNFYYKNESQKHLL